MEAAVLPALSTGGCAALGSCRVLRVCAVVTRPCCHGRRHLTLLSPTAAATGLPPLQVDCEVRAGEAERVGTDLLTSELADRLPGDMEGLAESFERLQHSLQQAQDYVDAVVVSRGLGWGGPAAPRCCVHGCWA